MKQRAFPFAVMAIVVFASLLAPSLVAQMPAADKLEHLSQVLNLSPQQKTQLAPIVEAEGPKMQAIAHDPNLPPKEKVKQLEAVQAKSDPLVRNILNPTQYKMWQQIRKDELEQIKRGGQ